MGEGLLVRGCNFLIYHPVRSKSKFVVDDNCCMCHFAGVKSMSKIRSDDVLLASFKNHVFEVRFFTFNDNKDCNSILYSPPLSYLSVY